MDLLVIYCFFLVLMKANKVMTNLFRNHETGEYTSCLQIFANTGNQLLSGIDKASINSRYITAIDMLDCDRYYL